jgi:hypothetical protein
LNTKETLTFVAVFLSILLMSAFFALPKHGVIVYNCSIAEISPDIPPDVREECRKRNAQKI